MSTPSPIVAKIRSKAMAWMLANHHVTLGQAMTYLLTYQKNHWPIIVETWREHGLSTQLFDLLSSYLRPSPSAESPTEETSP